MKRVCKELEHLITSAEELVNVFESGSTIGFSGFTLAGYPKIVPKVLAKLGNVDNLTVITGASVGDQLDGEFARNKMVSRRYPYQSNKDLRSGINDGTIAYQDVHLGKLPKFIEQNDAKIDVAVIECAAVLNEGLVPTYSMGISDVLVKRAKKIIIEINTTVPIEIYGMHDCFSDYKNVPIKDALERIGKPYIPCDMEKIVGIVFSEEEDIGPKFKVIDESAHKIGENIVKFLEKQVEEKRFDNTLLPLQSGIGSIANAVFHSLGENDFHDLVMYTEVCQDTALELLEKRVIRGISSSALCVSKEARERIKANINWYKERIVLRPQGISNCGEVINRLDVISINTPLEMDIYGNVNSTHVTGTKIMNGIGGSADFSRNAKICIFAAPSITKAGAISTVVPMVTHVDHTEHDVDVLITEQGIADLRGLSPREKALEIVNHCAHPLYKDRLMEYYEDSLENVGGHIPHNLEKAFSFHVKYLNEGKM